MSVILLSLLACTHGKSGQGGDDTGPGSDGGAPAPAQPLAVTGFGADVAIAATDGSAQGEPAAIALPDGSILASWMETQSDGQTLYVMMTRSTDGGATWSTPVTVDEDRWGWQNDPHFAFLDGRVFYTWLAIESNNGSKGSIYCVDSTDGGVTWSDKTKLSTESDSVDRQWMAQGAGKVVITWDSFRGSYNEDQVYSESSSDCAGFAAPETIVSGVFLNGVPAVDTDGNVWVSRNEFSNRSIRNVITEKTNSGWVDVELESYEYPNGAYYAMFAEHDEEEESRPEAPVAQGPNLTRAWFDKNHGRIPRAAANGTYTGEYSPILAASPKGGLTAVTLPTESSDADFADIVFYRLRGGAIESSQGPRPSFRPSGRNEGRCALLAGGGCLPPHALARPPPPRALWARAPPARFSPRCHAGSRPIGRVLGQVRGGIHVTWYDGREDKWRLYGASSVDDGATWTEYPAGDSTFRSGFDENTYADYYSWVGHFQGLVTTADHVVAIFGDSHTTNTSRIYAASSVNP